MSSSERVHSPFRPRPSGGNLGEFLRKEAAGAIVLGIATITALLIANSGLHGAFEHFWETEAGFALGSLHFEQTLRHWVDDALMALFFLVVGLEMKREFIIGELSTWKGAALPVFAALGGMLVPAAIFFALNVGTPAARGWGVPMATDIAFALGVLAILGRRIPPGLKVFLAALAIADDLGAILVIAFFYSKGIDVPWLLIALVPIAGLVAMNRANVREPLAYLGMGSILWFAVLNSGIHATIAGVITALAIPATPRLSAAEFTVACRETVDAIDACQIDEAHPLQDDRQERLALDLARGAGWSVSTLQRVEFALLPFTTFVVLPLFALANAGVRVVGAGDVQIASSLVFGVVAGLVLGKPIGIMIASWIAVRSGLAALPTDVTWRHITGAGIVAGIGFTMSLFVANLAFGVGALSDDVKVGILIASVSAGLIGYFVLLSTDSAAAVSEE